MFFNKKAFGLLLSCVLVGSFACGMKKSEPFNVSTYCESGLQGFVDSFKVEELKKFAEFRNKWKNAFPKQAGPLFEKFPIDKLDEDFTKCFECIVKESLLTKLYAFKTEFNKLGVGVKKSIRMFITELCDLIKEITIGRIEKKYPEQEFSFKDLKKSPEKAVSMVLGSPLLLHTLSILFLVGAFFNDFVDPGIFRKVIIFVVVLSVIGISRTIRGRDIVKDAREIGDGKRDVKDLILTSLSHGDKKKKRRENKKLEIERVNSFFKELGECIFP